MTAHIIRIVFADGYTCGYTTLADDLAHAKRLARAWALTLCRRSPFTMTDQTPVWQALATR